MPWFALVLYLHLVAVVAAFAYASFIHLGLERLWSAETAPQALAALRLTARGGRKMPWVALALLVTGAYMTQVAYAWTTPWIDVSLVGWLVLEVVGSLSGRQRRNLAMGLSRAGGDRLDHALAQALRDPLGRASNYMLPLLTLGIMLVMVIKPGALASIVILVVAMGVGVALGLRRLPALTAEHKSASA